MKHGLLGPLVVLATSIAACSSGTSSTTTTPETLHPEATAADGGGAEGVPCTHPGAGASIGNDRCACTTTRKVDGEWSSLRTCREGDSCPTKNKGDTMIVTQKGTNVLVERADGYAAAGTLCGDVLVWTGGPKDGLNPECGQIRFADDGHYTSDSCYVDSGECVRSHSAGCPSEKGQCPGTGARKAEAAPAPITKVICN